MRLFLSYRRDDSEGHAGWLADNLTEISDSDDPVERFIDVYDIPPGRDFVREMLARVKECDAILAIIGKRWLTVTAEGGRRRLDEPEDPVRLELAAAIDNHIPLLVVLVDGAKQPAVGEVPPPIAEIARAQALQLRDAEFLSDARRLIAHLRSQGVTRRRPGETLLPAEVRIVNAKPGWWEKTSDLQVFMDGKRLGKILADKGVYTFRISSGQHWLQLRRGLYRSPKMELNLRAGKVITVGYVWKQLGGISWQLAEEQGST